jgi:hypothetical protein
VTLQKRGRELRIASQRVPPGVRREIPVHIRVIGQQPVRQATRLNVPAGIARLIVVRATDICPPGIRVSVKRVRGYRFTIAGSRSKPAKEAFS